MSCLGAGGVVCWLGVLSGRERGGVYDGGCVIPGSACAEIPYCLLGVCHGRGGRLAAGVVGWFGVWWVVVAGWAGLGLVVGPSVVLDIVLGVHIFIAL